MSCEHARALALLALLYSPHGAAPALPCAYVHSDCPYTQRHLLQALGRRRGRWRVATRASLGCGGSGSGSDGEGDGPPPLARLLPCALWIDEYETLDWGTALAPPFRLVSNFCIRKGLGRKGNLAEAVEGYLARHPGLRAALGPCFPHTTVLDTYATFHARPAWLDARSALAEALCEAEAAMAGAGAGAAWILKPSLTNKGAGLAIVCDFGALQAEVCRERDISQWVLQRYLRRSLLLLPLRAAAGAAPAAPATRHKFHVRLYAAAIGALEVHVFREALLLVAPEPYDAGALARTAAHITNTCVSQGSALFDEARHVRCLSELPALVAGLPLPPGAPTHEAAVAGLFADMCALTAHCFAAQEGKAAGFQPLPLGWELYGLDFLVTQGEEEEGEEGAGAGAGEALPWRAVLLEFNPTPDVRQTGDRLDGLIGGLFEGLLQLALDERVEVVAAAAECAGAGAGAGAGGAAATHVTVVPEGEAVGVRVRTEPRALGGVVPRAQLPAWHPGCSGCALPVALPARARAAGHHASGFDCVYGKRWPSAHNAMIKVG